MSKSRDIRRTANATQSMAQQMRWQNANEEERARMTKDATVVVYVIIGFCVLFVGAVFASFIVAAARM